MIFVFLVTENITVIKIFNIVTLTIYKCKKMLDCNMNV
jgi:hypothetical protein